MGEYEYWKDPVIICLAIYSLLTLAFIFERLIMWCINRAKTSRASRAVRDMLTSPNRDELKEAFETTEAPLSNVMGYVLKHDVSESPETTLLLLDDALEIEEKRQKRNLVFLAALAGTAPFLGLLGTVLGIIDTFTSIMEKGFGGPTVISAGIARALWTTAIGLVIAVPAFISYNLFGAAADNNVQDVRTQANRIFVALGDL